MMVLGKLQACRLFPRVDANPKKNLCNVPIKHLLFGMEFGLPVRPLNRPPGAEDVLTLMIHINPADLRSNNGSCKWHKVTVEMELNQPVAEIKHKQLSK